MRQPDFRPYFCSIIVDICFMNHAFVDALERWYEQNKRVLPWRDCAEPYKIWVSEIILQQTRVAQGYDYYIRFVERFPNVEELAAATEDEVLRYWQGLGYYSRARNMHAAAKQMVEAGGFPTSYAGIRALKGVGDYTAAAIASMAFGMPYAVVDGNVYRVLSRYLGIDEPVDTTAGRKLFAALADDMLDRKRPALYNQALMDFGALQCTPKITAERCAECPLADTCCAFGMGRMADFPVKKGIAHVHVRYFTYICVSAGGKIVLRKRTGRDIWRGLYEPPLVETEQPLTLEELKNTVPFSRLDETAQTRLSLVRQGVRHLLSHRLLLADFYLLETDGETLNRLWPSAEGWQQVDRRDIDTFAVSRLVSMLWQACGFTAD